MVESRIKKMTSRTSKPKGSRSPVEQWLKLFLDSIYDENHENRERALKSLKTLEKDLRKTL